MIGTISKKGEDLEVLKGLLRKAGLPEDGLEAHARDMLEDAREQAELKRAAWRHRSGR